MDGCIVENDSYRFCDVFMKQGQEAKKCSSSCGFPEVGAKEFAVKPLIISYFVDLRRGTRYNIEMFNSRYDHDTSSKLYPVRRIH